MPHDPHDLRDKFWLMVSDWMADNVPHDRTVYRVEYLRTRLNGAVYRHEHDAMNFIMEKINESQG